MAHSVASHLSVTPSTYDAEIRRFIPGYDAMLGEVAGALREHGAIQHVVDLGAGTGGLSQLVAETLPQARLTLIDVDPDMLAQARVRLAAAADRLTFSERSFLGPLPECDAAVAAFSLHHIPRPSDKEQLYREVHRALPGGGLFVIADAMMPSPRGQADALRRRWAAHLVAGGDTEAQAYARFAQWAEEDFYMPIDVELLALGRAGFAGVDVRWRVGPTAVLVATR